MTATPIRKDGHHPIITMQCGPIRYHLNEKKMAASTAVQHTVIPRQTDFALPHNMTEPSIQKIYHALAIDQRRSEMIVDDLLREIEAKQSPLLLTERTDHLQ
ncbi:MAG: hypothetical protein IPM66_15265 [Acidobacteriota bacterium]|nr:MAG: hypothetical protein IPM66_15265 [Acidobacteriota bacterium]